MTHIDYPKEVKDWSLPHYYGGLGFAPPKDIAALIWIALKTSGDIVELGCSVGMTTSHLARAFPSKRIIAVDWPQAELHQIQKPEKPRIAHDIAKLAHKYSNVFPVESDSRTFNFQHYAPLATMAFIDADHRYESVKMDTENALSKLKQVQGERYIAWHDCCPLKQNSLPWIGVHKYLAEQKLFEPILINETSMAFVKL